MIFQPGSFVQSDSRFEQKGYIFGQTVGFGSCFFHHLCGFIQVGQDETCHFVLRAALVGFGKFDIVVRQDFIYDREVSVLFHECEVLESAEEIHFADIMADVGI